MRQPESKAILSVLSFNAALGIGSLAASSCGSSPEAPPAAAPKSHDKPVPPHKHIVTYITFDALGGGSSIIQVYPGVENTLADRTADGTFANGQTVGAECKTLGRLVTSDPGVGEQYRKSRAWIEINGSPGQTQYATAVYIEEPQVILKLLPEC